MAEFLVELYFLPASIYYFWYQYQKAGTDGFLYWVTVENLISAAKCIFWPFLLVYDVFGFVFG
jgi:hypothetical protein